MAKAVVPMRAFREKFGDLRLEELAPKLHELMAQFLHDAPREKDVKSHKLEHEEIKTR
jgi:hypothetical protein